MQKIKNNLIEIISEHKKMLKEIIIAITNKY